MNRKYLARALKLGFSELCFYGDKVPVACHDERRDFVWATLDAESRNPTGCGRDPHRIAQRRSRNPLFPNPNLEGEPSP